MERRGGGTIIKTLVYSNCVNNKGLITSRTKKLKEALHEYDEAKKTVMKFLENKFENIIISNYFDTHLRFKYIEDVDDLLDGISPFIIFYNNEIIFIWNPSILSIYYDENYMNINSQDIIRRYDLLDFSEIDSIKDFSKYIKDISNVKSVETHFHSTFDYCDNNLSVILGNFNITNSIYKYSEQVEEYLKEHSINYEIIRNYIIINKILKVQNHIDIIYICFASGISMLNAVFFHDSKKNITEKNFYKSSIFLNGEKVLIPIEEYKLTYLLNFFN